VPKKVHPHGDAVVGALEHRMNNYQAAGNITTVLQGGLVPHTLFDPVKPASTTFTIIHKRLLALRVPDRPSV